MKTKDLLSIRLFIVHFVLPLALLLMLSLVFTLKISAQNLGITTNGTASYPQVNVGNTLTQTNSCAGNYLTVDQFTTTLPLTAISIRTFGTVSSGANNVKVSIYSDNGSNAPGTLLFTEVAATVTANTTSTITIPNTYLTPGKYWIAYNMNSSNSSANYITRSAGVTGALRKFQPMTYSTSFPLNPSSGTWTDAAPGAQDDVYFVGVPVQGYAKATKAILPAYGIFSSVSFYSHAAGNARLAIYSDASGAPSVKQWESGDLAVTASAWKTVTIPSGTPANLNLNAGTYWLAWQWNSAANGPSYTSGAASTGNAMVKAYGAFPASWSGGTASTENWSMYASYSSCVLPTVYTVSGGGSYCTGGTGVNINLSNSESGVNYELYRNGTATGTILPGTTGSGLIFNTITSAGNYSIVATRTVGGCTSQMSGSPSIAVNSIPSATVTNKTNINCNGGNDGSITILASGGTPPYSYSVDNGNHWVSSATDPLTFNGLKANTPYQIRVKDGNGCESMEIP